jgi:hypothetical protein
MASLSPYSGAAMDLGLGAQYRSQADDEQEQLRKKKLQQQQGQRFVPQAYGGAFMSLSGNQY